MYSGEENLVIAIDVGTTHSAISFAHLVPDEIAEVRLVNKWPGQPEASGDTKIPTIVAYQNGKPAAFGAEARQHLDDDEYEIARWFKLYLHQPLWDGNAENSKPPVEIPPLPTDVSLLEVYTHFIRYMFDSCQTFFHKNTPNGANIWKSFQSKSIIIICTPNGWESSQHSFLESVVVEAGIIKPEALGTRLRFVTEGEASVHYALAHTRGRSWLKEGTIFAVVDAGGSTVDSTLYQCQSVTPKLAIQEVCASECVQAGGIFVDRAAEALLQRKFINSNFGTEEFIKEMLTIFETQTKRVFDDTQDSITIPFGRSRDNDEANGIVKGKFTLTRREISGTFDWVINRILCNIADLIQNRDVQHILLVGGLGESPFLRKKLEEVYNGEETEIVVVDEPSKKAASEGAITWYIKKLVAGRRARFTIGARVFQRYNPDLDWHREGAQFRFWRGGEERLGNIFSVLIPKNMLIEEGYTEAFRFFKDFESLPRSLENTKLALFAWEGDSSTHWILDQNGYYVPGMRRLCNVNADLSPLLPFLEHGLSTSGKDMWVLDFCLRVNFGDTQIKACLEWYEGPTVIVGDPACGIRGHCTLRYIRPENAIGRALGFVTLKHFPSDYFNLSKKRCRFELLPCSGKVK